MKISIQKDEPEVPEPAPGLVFKTSTGVYMIVSMVQRVLKDSVKGDDVFAVQLRPESEAPGAEEEAHVVYYYRERQWARAVRDGRAEILGKAKEVVVNR